MKEALSVLSQLHIMMMNMNFVMLQKLMVKNVKKITILMINSLILWRMIDLIDILVAWF